MKKKENEKSTLRSDQNHRNVGRVTVVGHFGVKIVNGVERRFVLQTEHEHDCVDPVGKL